MSQVYQFFNKLAPLSALGHINSQIQASTILTIVTILDARIPDSSFSESKARCRMGHEARKRGATSSGANSPAILAFLQKGGQGQKIFCFCDFFFAEPIFAWGMKTIFIFLHFFFADNNTLCRELIIFANL